MYVLPETSCSAALFIFLNFNVFYSLQLFTRKVDLPERKALSKYEQQKQTVQGNSMKCILQRMESEIVTSGVVYRIDAFL